MSNLGEPPTLTINCCLDFLEHEEYKMRRTPTYIIQSLKENGQWHTRSRLNELNHALIGGEITEQQLMHAAYLIMQKWSINYSDSATLRVVIERAEA